MIQRADPGKYEPPPIDELARRIVEAFDPERVLLFGSRARGDARPDSDVDLFVELRTALSPRERRLAVERLFRPRLWSLDLVVYTPDEVRSLRDRVGSLLRTVEQEGRVLYERAAG